MEKDKLDKLTDVTNRGKGQTLFLLKLLDGDILKLLELEEKLKNNFLHYCPADKEECEKVLSMGNGKDWYKLRVVSLEDGLFERIVSF